MARLARALHLAAYDTAVKLRGYNGPITLFQAVNRTDSAQVLRRVAPNMGAQEHLRLSAAHEAQSQTLCKLWRTLVERAMQATFGRSYRVGDYKVSGVARDEFPDWYKGQLRFASQAGFNHSVLAQAHRKVAALLSR